LAAIAIPRFTQMTDKANQSAFKSTHRTIVAAVQMYMAASDGATPADLDALSDYLNEPSSTSSIGKPDGATYEVSNGKVTSTYGTKTLEWEP
jgi:type II secretory pathway pseudopilin PulG